MAIRIVRLGTARGKGEGVRLGTVRRQMKEPAHERLLDALAKLSRDADFAVGCYCEDYERCHRSILREILDEHGARIASNA
jgi:uncharacterized protein YeaO (DUF488 family)